MFREDPEVYIMNSTFELAGDSNRVFTFVLADLTRRGSLREPGKYTMRIISKMFAVDN